MFFYQRKYKEVQSKEIKIRDEWGVLHRLTIYRGIPLLTNQELADQLEVSVTTVITHRRD